MRVNRESLLRTLESLSPGLATREIIDQSSCFVFVDNMVCTFNEEIFCFCKTPIKIEGAVKAKPLLELLSKLPEDQLDVEQVGGELLVHGKRRKSGIRMESEVRLPMDTIEVPDEWRELSSEFSDAVNIVQSCASKDDAKFVLTCVHVHPDYLEACDRFQIARYPVDTGVSKSVLVRASSLKQIVGFDMAEISETSAWLHFRNSTGLVLSCRKYLDDYVSLSGYLSLDGAVPITLPGGLGDIVGKAEIFSSDNAVGNNILIDLREGRVMFRGEGASGWYKEMREVSYQGEPCRFWIAPKLLVELSKKATDCLVGNGKLAVNTGKFVFATCTTVDDPDSEEG